MKSSYFTRIKSGDITVIDDISDQFRTQSALTNGRQIKSLLSKMAFLINPHNFSLMDNFAKDSLWKIIRHKKQIKKVELENYSTFFEQSGLLIKENLNNIKELNNCLSDFKPSDAYSFFTDNQAAYQRRVFDKYLWLMRATSNGKVIVNNAYPRFFEF